MKNYSKVTTNDISLLSGQSPSSRFLFCLLYIEMISRTSCSFDYDDSLRTLKNITTCLYEMSRARSIMYIEYINEVIFCVNDRV